MTAGLWLHQRKPLKLNSHGQREQSLFRYGFDFLRGLCLNFPFSAPSFVRLYNFPPILSSHPGSMTVSTIIESVSCT